VILYVGLPNWLNRRRVHRLIASRGKAWILWVLFQKTEALDNFLMFADVMLGEVGNRLLNLFYEHQRVIHVRYTITSGTMAQS